MMEKEVIGDRYRRIQESLADTCARIGRPADSVRCIAVTKMHPVETAQAVVDAGIVDIGENRVQEIQQKAPLLKGRHTVHLIGHLQSNKVTKAVGLVDWVQSVDSVKILEKLDEVAGRLSKRLNICIQVNTSGEEQKSGCHPGMTTELCERAHRCDWLDVRGLMTIGPLGGDERDIRRSFTLLRTTGEHVAHSMEGPVELSMGMSNDYLLAVEEGATMVRIGSALVGSRPAR